jgi:hypothetical protein
MRPLGEEIQALMPAFAGDDVSGRCSSDNPAIHFQVLAAPDADYLIAVNVTDRPQNCRFVLDRKTGTRAEVLFENRSIPCENGENGLQDNFSRLERHVYRMQGTRPEAAP